MKFYILVVAILAFSTLIDAATFKCLTRDASAAGEGTSGACTDKKCIAYYDDDGKNIGACVAVDDGCSAGPKTNCKECTTDDCNTRALIRKCHLRDADTAATAEGAKDTLCDPAASDAKCVAYTKDGKNWAKCNPGGCTTALLTSNPDCKDCATDNCNKRALIRKCHLRNADTAATAEGAKDTLCDPAASDAKCVAYTSGGKNWAKCNPGGCTSVLLGTNPDCKDCATDNCNTRALLATTAAPTTAAGGAAPTTAAGGAATTTPRAAATRASVGWQTGIMAASACVLVLMKPF